MTKLTCGLHKSMKKESRLPKIATKPIKTQKWEIRKRNIYFRRIDVRIVAKS